MPQSARRPCAATGCAALVARGTRYCPAHAKEKRAALDRGRESSTQRGYGWAWQRLRSHVLMVEPLCRECAAWGRVVAATDVDHVTPKSQGGTDDLFNLQSLCHSCHSAKTMRELAMGLHGGGVVKTGVRQP